MTIEIVDREIQCQCRMIVQVNHMGREGTMDYHKTLHKVHHKEMGGTMDLLKTLLKVHHEEMEGTMGHLHLRTLLKVHQLKEMEEIMMRNRTTNHNKILLQIQLVKMVVALEGIRITPLSSIMVRDLLDKLNVEMDTRQAITAMLMEEEIVTRESDEMQYHQIRETSHNLVEETMVLLRTEEISEGIIGTSARHLLATIVKELALAWVRATQGVTKDKVSSRWTREVISKDNKISPPWARCRMIRVDIEDWFFPCSDVLKFLHLSIWIFQRNSPMKWEAVLAGKESYDVGLVKLG